MEIAPMTKRDKILLYVVLMLAFVVLFVRFLLIPGIENHQQADADLREAQDAQTSMQDAIMLAGTYAAEKNNNWGELQTANASYYSLLSSDELDTLVTGLELNHSMQPVSLSIGQPLTQSMTGYIAGTQAGQSPAPAGSAAAAVTADQVVLAAGTWGTQRLLFAMRDAGRLPDLSPLLACDPATAPEVLWFIAEHEPELRRWLVANPSADAALLEYVAQAGGPGVNRALTILLDGLPAA